MIVSFLLIGTAAAVDTAGVIKEKTKLQSLSDIATLAAAASGEEDLKALKKVAEASLAAKKGCLNIVKILETHLCHT